MNVMVSRPVALGFSSMVAARGGGRVGGGLPKQGELISADIVDEVAKEEEGLSTCDWCRSIECKRAPGEYTSKNAAAELW